MAKSLQERIQAALNPSSARLADMRSTLAAAEQALSTLASARTQAEDLAQDLSRPVEQARQARDEAEEIAFEMRRLERAAGQLKDAIAAKEADESYQRRQDDYAAAKADRDELAELLRERVPALFAELVGLAAIIKASDQHLAAVNQNRPGDSDRLLSAEVVARRALNTDMWPTRDPLYRLTRLKLPHFDRPGELWPPADFDASAFATAVPQKRRPELAA